MKKFLQLIVIGSIAANISSCNQKDSCEDVVCQNGGQCVDGDCDCPDGFSGPNCEMRSFGNGVFILHEGAFLGGNASVSFYNKSTNALSNGVFNSVNGIPLGDTGQSIEIRDGKAYIVVNNSGKIEVVNLEDFSSAGTLSGLASPRYIAFASDSKAYVSDLSANAITVFNPQTLSVDGTIYVNGQVEEMVTVGGNVIAAGSGANQVYKIDPATNTFTDSVYVGLGPAQLVVDENQKVWVQTNGGFGTEAVKLVRIDPATMDIELTLDLPISQNYSRDLEINGSGSTLYFIDGGVYQMNIDDVSLPATEFAPIFGYKCGVDPVNGMVYVSDAGDFSSNGSVYRFEATGTPVDTLAVSVVPGEYGFTQ